MRLPYAEGSPQRKQTPVSSGASSGMQRGVAAVSALIASSQSVRPQWNTRAQPFATCSGAVSTAIRSAACAISARRASSSIA